MSSVNPTVRNKVFSADEFRSVYTKADEDHDGHLTSTELNTFKQTLTAANGTVSNQRDLDISTILKDNFNPIAYRALKKGEVTTQEIRPEDSTIELSEINKIAGFDGRDTNVTRTDFRNLQGGSAKNWPTRTVTSTNTGGSGTTGGTTTGTTNDLGQLVQLLLLLLLGSGGGGGYPSAYPPSYPPIGGGFGGNFPQYPQPYPMPVPLPIEFYLHPSV